MKTTTILSCIVAASLGCSTATQSPAPGDGPESSPAAQTAGVSPGEGAQADRRSIPDPRTGGPIFTGAATLPSPLKEVGR